MRKRLFAWMLSRLSGRHEALVTERKRELLADVSGTVVEIGPGTGPNLAYLAPGTRWVGIEPNPFMHAHLLSAARAHGIDARLAEAPGERLPFDDASVDVVLCTLVLCSAREPARLVAEARRVLRPGGRFLVLEHVAAPRGSWTRRAQELATPFTRLLADGCRQDRETWRLLDDAGFESVEREHFDVRVPWRWPHLVARCVR